MAKIITIDMTVYKYPFIVVTKSDAPVMVIVQVKWFGRYHEVYSNIGGKRRVFGRRVK